MATRNHSQIAGLKSLKEFEAVRWGPFGDIETFSDFQGFLERGEVNLATDPLGSVLQVINFYSERSRLEGTNAIVDYDSEKVAALLQYGIERNPKVSLFQNLGGPPANAFYDFIEQWRRRQRTTPRWNPSYASVSLPDGLVGLCRTSSPQELIVTLDIQLEGDMKRWSNRLYPLSGWELAEGFRLSYESHLEK